MADPLGSGAPAPSLWIDCSEQRPQRAKPLARKVEVAFLNPSGEIMSVTRHAPALPLFDEAFSAVARGALITTPDGLVAVEDLLPGQRVITDIGTQRLLWIGKMNVYPNNPETEPPGVIRVITDALGYARPMHDLMLADHARLVHQGPRCRDIVGQDSALAPARAFIDGFGVFSVTPHTSVPMYQLGFKTHRSYYAGGIALASVHPGVATDEEVDRALMSFYLGFFPHLERVEDFGPLNMPRLTKGEVETLLAA